MTLTIKHIWKDEGLHYDCSIDKIENVRYFETKFDEDGQNYIEIYFEDKEKQHQIYDLDHDEDCYDLIECY